ncbi:MAG TPA: InlB B-repeat-containing protein [Chitinispirillaceae bacterium]|nr:InlB B-repeat-containing protein [Chitinispirillaceae bacterium]
MRKVAFLSVFLIGVSIILLMTCTLPMDPIKNPDNLKIEFFLTNKQLTVLKNDSVQVGVVINIPSLVKNLQVEHGDNNKVEALSLPDPGSTTFDTVYFRTMYATTGTKTITVKALRIDDTTKEFTMPLIVTAPEMNIVFDSIPSVNSVVFANTTVTYQIVSHTVPSTIIRYTVRANPPLDENQLSIRGNTSGELLFKADTAGVYTLSIVATNDVVRDSVMVKVLVVTPPGLTQTYSGVTVKPGSSDTLTFTGLISESLVLSDTSGFKSGEITVLQSGSNNVLKILFKPKDSKAYTFPIKVSGSTMDGTLYSGIYAVEQIVSSDKPETDTTRPAIVLKNPQKQDQRLFTDTVTVQIECTDDNGIFSVISARAGKTLEVIENGSLYSVKLSGLNRGKSDTVQFVVTDNSTAKNKKEYMVILHYNLKPSAVSLLAPADDTTGVIAKPAFSWTGGEDSDGDSIVYTLRYGKSETSLDKVISGITGKKVTPASGLDANTLYYWQVIAVTPVNGDSVLSDIWSFTTVEGALVITEEPAGQKVALGSKGTFSVTATGVNLKYQWYKGDSLITGATAATYTTPSVTASSDGSVYKCAVSNGGGNVTSADAELTVVYNVTYDLNGGTGSVPVDENVYAKDETVIVKAGTGLTRTNFAFGGWGLNPTENTKVYTANETMKTGEGNLTLYAVWNQLYTVSYNSSGSGTAPEGGKYAQGVEVVIAGNTGALVNTGYEFAGWNTTVNGTGTNYVAGQKITMGAADLVLYAKWAQTFGVTYDANGGGAAGGHGSGSVPVDTRKYVTDSTVTVLGNTGNLARTGYVFGGWSTEQNGPAVSSFKMGSINVTVYARWVISDVDGNEYTEITLAGRVWMVQNLRVTKLRDKTPLSSTSQKTPAYVAGDAIRGHLYNGYAFFLDSLAPKGWHVASREDWDTLSSLYYENAKAIASKNGWMSFSENTNAVGYNNGLTNNSSGLTIPPNASGERAEFWIGNSLFEIDNNNVIGAIYFMTYDSQYFSFMGRMGAEGYFSIRCVRDY